MPFPFTSASELLAVAPVRQPVAVVALVLEPVAAEEPAQLAVLPALAARLLVPQR